MNAPRTLTHKFVDSVPDTLEEGTLYVSIRFKTVIHKCCCGCGNQVVTPLSPSDWKLTFDGRSISLYPSIGNWKFPCRSHYWIKGNKVKWAPQRLDAETNAGASVETIAVSKSMPDVVQSKIKTDVVPGLLQRVQRAWLKIREKLTSH